MSPISQIWLIDAVAVSLILVVIGLFFRFIFFQLREFQRQMLTRPSADFILFMLEYHTKSIDKKLDGFIKTKKIEENDQGR